MARGDVIAGMVGVAGDSGVAVQPAPGEEWLIEMMSCCGDDTNMGPADVFDGTFGSTRIGGVTYHAPYFTKAIVYGTTIQHIRYLLQFTDSVYFRLWNHNAATEYLSYHGVKMK